MRETKTKRHSLKLNFIFNFISQILTLIVPLITMPYLSRILHEAGNGQFSYANSIITYFILFSNLGFDIYGQRQIARAQDDREEKSRIFWELFLLKSAFTAVSLAILYGVAFGGAFGDPYTKLILLLSIQVIAVPFDIQFLFRGEEDFASIAIRMIIMRTVGLACIFIFVKNETHTWVYALCFSVSVIASNLMMWPAAIGRIRFVSLKKMSFARHLLPSLLIFLPTLAVTVYSVFDKTMIGWFAQNPDYENGCYEQAYKINSVALLLVTIISSVMMSRNAHDYETGDIERVRGHIYSASSYVWMMGTPLIVGFCVLSGNLSSWFLGSGYAEVPLLLCIMSVRFIVSGLGEVLGNQLFIAIKKEKYPTIATLAAAVVNIVMNYFLIRKMGATGAAIATAVCECTVALLLLALAVKGKYVSLKRLLLLSWKYIVAAGVMFVPIYFMQQNMPNAIWSFLVITLTGVAVYALCLLLLRDRFFLRHAKQTLGAAGRLFKRRAAAETGAAEEQQTEDAQGRESADAEQTEDKNV